MNGLLLLNLGTPEAPTTGAVRAYLREFLWDARVLDIHPVARALLLYGIILPFRPKKSAAAYAKVWMPEGSPLLVHSEALTMKVGQELGQEWSVALGMRYGNPSIQQAIERMTRSGVKRIAVLPLYPQFATSSTASMLEKVYKISSEYEVPPRLSVAQDFFDDPRFTRLSAKKASQHAEAFAPDHVLFSFHGVPERQIRRASPSEEHCKMSGSCCDKMTLDNRNCYRAQSYETARQIAGDMGLSEEQYTVGFQSRLGRTPWIKPWSDEIITELAGRGIKRLLVSCPSFTADCLETLEEIGIRAKEDFIAAGGEDLQLVPCLNSDPDWVESIASMARDLLRA